MDGASTTEDGLARPWTVVALVAVLGVNALYSVFVQAGSPNLWNVLFALFFLSLLKALWDGERGVWWLFVILSAAATGGGVVVALDEPAGLLAVGGGALTLGLLLAPATRPWFSADRSEVAGGATP